MVKINQQKGAAPIKGTVPFIVSASQMLRWLCLGAAGVVMFLSVTNIITYEVAPVPLLWVIPLGIYLMLLYLISRKTPGVRPGSSAISGLSLVFGHDVLFIPKTFFTVCFSYFFILLLFIPYLHVHSKSADPIQACFRYPYDLVLCDDLIGGIFRRNPDQLDHSFDIQYPDRIFSWVIIGFFECCNRDRETSLFDFRGFGCY